MILKIVLISSDESRVGMGVRTLSACLRENGFETLIVFMANLDADYRTFNWNDLFSLCDGAGLIGISCMSHSNEKACEIKKRLSERQGTPIDAGGIHASICPESLLSMFSYICHGEGEDLIVEMAHRIDRKESLASIPGLWSNEKGIITKNPAIPLKRDINDYPFPDYSIEHQYVIDGDRLVKIRPVHFHMSINDFVVMGSRGCPHQCTYCCNKKIKKDFPWRRKVQHYSVNYLIENLKTVRIKFPEVQSIWIEDDTFFAKSAEEISLFASRYKQEISLPFKILISPWTYSKDKLDLLVHAGLSSLIMGIQSGCERVNRELYDRNMSKERIQAIVKSLHGYTNLLKCYDFIGMNPFESAEDLIETIRFIKSIPVPYYIFSNNLAFYPGTELHEKALKSTLNTSRRVKHSEASVGYGIIIHENIKHKIFHLIILLMAGMSTRFKLGCIPRFLVSEPAIRVYFYVDSACPWLSDRMAVLIAILCDYCNWKRMVKRLFSPRTIASIRHILAAGRQA